ncbi:MAG: StlD/DarB family beta-ketosynthase [Proteobacteria bacterium]|nr:StlD/DarB family beta-ketosynthase [Pseudomonadota bacterium]
MDSLGYISSIGTFLPNSPVKNDDIESVLGIVGGLPSRTKRMILRSNGIKTRHYAIDEKTGLPTHTNASMVVEAVRGLAGMVRERVGVLACGTSSPSGFVPSHGSHVHAALSRQLGGFRGTEVMSVAGVCLSGLSALKYATLSVAHGSGSQAIATGSELVSPAMRASNFDELVNSRLPRDFEENIALSFEDDFLRWMLSDGAGAVLITPRPLCSRALRVDWIDMRSYAGEYPVCMYAGGVRSDEGEMIGWQILTPEERSRKSAMNLRQDARLLNAHIIEAAILKPLPEIAEKRQLSLGNVDWYLPHISSEYFRPLVASAMRDIKMEIPAEKWITTLSETGNVGSASMYFMLDALLKDSRLRNGDRILVMIPESARFSVGYMHLTAFVEG